MCTQQYLLMIDGGPAGATAATHLAATNETVAAVEKTASSLAALRRTACIRQEWSWSKVVTSGQAPGEYARGRVLAQLKFDGLDR